MKTPLKLKIICHLQCLQRERKMKKQFRKNKNNIGYKKPTKTGRKNWLIKKHRHINTDICVSVIHLEK